MRVRFGVAMAEKGGRSAVVGVEVLETRLPDGRLEHTFYVGSIDRPDGTIEGTAAVVDSLMVKASSARPCALVDVGTPQGMALRQSLLGRWTGLHRPHAYPGTGARRDLFAAFLEAYSAGRITFAPHLPNRRDLDKSLVFYLSGGARKSGVELASEEDALVIALGLALYWPRHGPQARSAATARP
jgi:hypothetical protein